MAERPQRDQPAYPIGSVDKALRLIILVAQRPSGIRIGDAAAALGVAPSTAHRLLQMLALHGFAEQDPETKAYHAGPTVARLGDPRERARQAAQPLLTEIVEQFQETAHLSTLDGMQAVTLFSVESPHMLRVGDRSGHAQPAYLSGMGRALLSGRDIAEVTAAAREADPSLDEKALAGHLREVAERGFVVQHGEVESGVSALAVPVRGSTGTIEYAIGVTFPTGRIADADIPRLAEAMKTAAAQLEAELRR